MKIIDNPNEPLIVMEQEPPSESWFRMWEDWFIKEAGQRNEHVIRRFFQWARKGAASEQDARKAAKVELAEMLESLARQIRQ
jgi:hypothetical protein